MTVRRNGTERETLRTRMGILIRDQGANIGSYFELVMGRTHVSSRTSERSERDPGPITTNAGVAPRWGRSSSVGLGGRLRHAFQKRVFRGLHRVGGSDMHPDAVQPQAKQALLL